MEWLCAATLWDLVVPAGTEVDTKPGARVSIEKKPPRAV